MDMVAVTRPRVPGGEYACLKLATMMLAVAVPVAAIRVPAT
jgi:hypothetical protein